MKTILNIIVILLVAAIIAGGFYLVVNNTSIASGPGGEGSQPPAMTGADRQTMDQLPTHSEGSDGGSASFGRGLLEILVTLAKLTGITSVVLLVENGFSQIKKRAPKPAQG
jgi:hypothetical protein